MGSPPKRLFHFLTMLTAAAKISAAQELRRMAADLERQAENDASADRARQAVQRHRTARNQVVAQIARMIAAGISTPQIVTRFPDFTPEQLEALTARAAPVAARIRRQERNREISRLAERGWTNAALAGRFGISESQVTRILSRIWRRRPT